MKVTDKDVAYVADLANLELTADERSRMLRDLNSILEYVERLSELDTGKVAPMAQVYQTATALMNRGRAGADAPGPGAGGSGIPKTWFRPPRTGVADSAA